eukprot:CAMPEP_0206529136 /NCGR_PEP_ID=MMETSP0325_2-20121206/2420_1 /ASSEMBLY_ACC=CAM_ASM_000347 /TAXON_ID=2866 /ORGANISM="Crypthecodinium cohnii, Strain Seligo" /LENGTH=344 /DNA_ID=CAMNT_0054024991 /DNA_START=14 /DNA_END=1044 /DNA_ORIENTATION=+
MSLISHGLANAGQGPEMLYHLADNNGRTAMLSRAEGMRMDVIRDKDCASSARRPIVPRESASLQTRDIEGALPEYPHRRVHREGPPVKEVIEGSVARTLYPERYRPLDLSLTTCDIPKAQPSAADFKTNRVVDPLVPNYSLPTSRDHHPITPPRVWLHEGRVHDSMEFKGAHKPRILERSYGRNPNDCADIEKASATLRIKEGSTPRQTLSVVEKAGERIMTTKCHSARASNPLDPVYKLPSGTAHPTFRGEGHSAVAPREVGEIEGAKTRQLHRDNHEPQNSLIRNDIPGAMPMRYKGCIPFNIQDPPQLTARSNRHMGLDCSDIEGTQPGTRKAGTWAILGS